MASVHFDDLSAAGAGDEPPLLYNSDEEKFDEALPPSERYAAAVPRPVPRTAPGYMTLVSRAGLLQLLHSWDGLREQVLSPLLRPRKFCCLPSTNVVEIFTFVVYLTVHFAYLGVSLLNGENYKEKAKALGGLLQANLIILMLLGLRNTPLRILLGMSSESVYYWHGLCGFFFIFYTAIHGMLAAIYYRNDFDGLWEFKNFSGVLSALCFFIVGLFAFPQIRRHLWEVFRFFHLFMIPGVILLFWHHSGSDMIGLIFIFVVPYLFDLGSRLISNLQSRHARITSCTSAGNLVRLSIAAPHIAGYPGAWVLVYIPSLKWFQQHPFSIAYASEGRVILFIRAMGGFTNALLAAAPEITNARVYLEGPYGHLRFTPDRYAHCFLFAAGSGLSPALGILQAFRAASGQSIHPPSMTIVWSVRTAAEIDLYREEIEQHAVPEEQWLIYVTGSQQLPLATQTHTILHLPTEPLYYAGRANAPELLERFRLDLNHIDPHLRKAGLYAFGPSAFVSTVQDAAARLPASDHDKSGFSFDFAEEAFEF